MAYQLQGEKEKAEKTFKKAIRLDSKLPDAYLRYGNFLFDEERYEESCEKFTKAAGFDFYNKRAVAFYNLGYCHRKQDNLDLAEAAFDRCLALQPDYRDAYIELADIMFIKKSYPDAKRYFDRYVKSMRETGDQLNASSIWLGIQLERVFGNKDAEASLALQLKNKFPYSAEYLEYKNSMQKR